MITDVRVLQPEFVPKEIQHRDNKLNILVDSLDPVVDGDRGETTFLFGPSGVGKTCIARYTVQKLEEQAFSVTTQYVNAWEDHTKFKLLYRILEGIDRSFDIHRQSTPTDELVERLRKHDDDQYVVIIDEVDQLTDKSVLYDLYRIKNLTMVLIANREAELFAGLDERLNSRLSTCSRINFDPYSHNELVSILSDRVEWGLDPDVINDKQIAKIADAAAGDARKAIGILRQAAKTAHQNGHDMITTELILEAIPEARVDIKQKSLGKLTDDQRLLYDIIESHGEIAPKVLYEKYSEQADDAFSKRMMRNHLDKMQHYNLVTAKGATRSRVYKPVNYLQELAIQ